MSKLVTILSIDGGGIRGLIPAMVLAEIEKRTQHRIAELFDLIAGTSTGGILALGLTKPDSSGRPQFTAEEAIGLYDREGAQVFNRSTAYQIQSGGGTLDAKYPAEGIESVLEQYFRDARLKDSCTQVLITAYEIERRFPFFFKSRHAKDPTRLGYNFLMKKAARATSAAPTYFPPLKLEAEPGDTTADYYALVDGGVFANNPAMCAYVEARKMFPKADEFLLVSLGTGELTRPLPYTKAKGWGLVEWAVPILNVVFDGVSDTVDYQLRQLLPPKSYYRFQVRLDEGNDDLDDTSQDNIHALRREAEKLIRENDKALTELCKQLVKIKVGTAKAGKASRRPKSVARTRTKPSKKPKAQPKKRARPSRQRRR